MFSLPLSPARWLSVCALVFSLAATSTQAVTTETIDLDRLIRCIEAREGARWSHPGGALQFTRATWREFSTDPYHRASQPDKARQIARKALFQAIQQMEMDGIRPTVWLLALRWNCGYEGMKRRMREPWSYAEHVHNLYYDDTNK
jgi:hypothetical protein